MQKLITTICVWAVVINIFLFITAYLYDVRSLMWLSIINTALLGTRFLIFKGEQK